MYSQSKKREGSVRKPARAASRACPTLSVREEDAARAEPRFIDIERGGKIRAATKEELKKKMEVFTFRRACQRGPSCKRSGGFARREI